MAKYASADGGLLWEKRFTRPASVADSSHYLTLGPDGMVAVARSSNGGYATVVYRDVSAVSIDLISTGVRLRVTGLPGRSYKLQHRTHTRPHQPLEHHQHPNRSCVRPLRIPRPNPPASAALYRASEP